MRPAAGPTPVRPHPVRAVARRRRCRGQL